MIKVQLLLDEALKVPRLVLVAKKAINKGTQLLMPHNGICTCALQEECLQRKGRALTQTETDRSS